MYNLAQLDLKEVRLDHVMMGRVGSGQVGSGATDKLTRNSDFEKDTDSKNFSFQRFKCYWFTSRMQELPQTMNSHLFSVAMIPFFL